MSAPLNSSAVIVDKFGRATRALIAYLQSLGTGTIERTTYTAAELALMEPDKVSTAFCADSSVTTFGSVLAGGGTNTVPVYWDLTDWRVG